MKLYQMIDGTLAGFYQEEGRAVQVLLYKDVYEQLLVTKTREEEVVIAGYYEQYDIVTPGYWKEEEVYVQGHYERRMVWHPEYSVTRYREVPGHYEIQSIWTPEYYVTRYYWQEAVPARGIVGHWREYEELIPAGYKDQRVWVDTYTESYEEIIPAGERETRVWVEGEYVTQRTWVPESTRTETVWVEPVIETRTVEYQELEEVYVGQQPVYSYADSALLGDWEIGELMPGVMDVPEFTDVITITNTLTGEVMKTTAKYLGMATRIDDNEYVVP